VYGRYLRFENSTGNADGVKISNLAIYDVYGKNVANGKMTVQPSDPTYGNLLTTQGIPINSSASFNALSSTGYTTTGSAGDWWEIDLGQPYFIKDISVSLSVTVPYVIYGSYREELMRGFTSSARAPFTIPTNPTKNTNIVSIRYIRIAPVASSSSTSTQSPVNYSLKHLAVVDSRGMDIGVWKPVRQVARNSVFKYSTLDGRYSNTITIENIWDLDLGGLYDVCSLICYGSGTGFNITTYNSTGTIVSGPTILTAMTSSPQTITLSTGGFTTIQKTIQYGKKTRYVTLNGAGRSMKYRAIVVVDSLGRNVTYNAALYDDYNEINTSLPFDLGRIVTTNVFNQIDLGQEYNIAFIIVYYYTSTPSSSITSPLSGTFDTSLKGATVTLMDATWNTTATKILAGTGSTYTTKYSVGDVFTTNANVTNVTKTCITVGNTITGFMVDMAINAYDIYALTTLNNKNTIYKLVANNRDYVISGSYVFPDSYYIYGVTLYKNILYYVGKYVDELAGVYMKLYTQPVSFIGSTPTSIGNIQPPANNSYCKKMIFGSTLAYFLFNTGKVYTAPITSITTPKFTDGVLNVTYTQITGANFPSNVTYICIDASDNLYLAATGSYIYKYSGGTITTFNGFNNPIGLVLDNNNFLYVADTDNHMIKVVSPTGTVSTVLGTGTTGTTDLIGSTPATFASPNSLVIDSDSNIFVGENAASLRKITVTYTPVFNNINLPFIGPYTSSSPVTFGTNTSSNNGIQIFGNNFVGASYAEVLDFTT